MWAPTGLRRHETLGSDAALKRQQGQLLQGSHTRQRAQHAYPTQGAVSETGNRALIPDKTTFSWRALMRFPSAWLNAFNDELSQIVRCASMAVRETAKIARQTFDL
jgi:hypothetical protein